MPIVRDVVNTTRGAVQAVRDIRRLREIAQVLVRHGFGFLVANVEVPGIARLRSGDGQDRPMPVRARLAMEDLGPTFIKLGQVLSTRPDLIPEAFVAELQSLQDSVPQVPWEEIRAEMERELGPALDASFESIDPEPIATASIAQVHRARLRGGEDVVVKVRRPGVRERVATDINILYFLARQTEAQFPEAKLLDLSGIVREFDKSMESETDLRVEARNTERCRSNFEGDDDIVVPTVYRACSTAGVLTLEYLPGVKLRLARENGSDMRRVGELYLHAASRMLYEHGFFHSDLHPGNVLVLPGDRLGLLDFGMVGRLTDDMKDHVVGLMFALHRRDFRTIARIFWEIGIKDEQVSYPRFEADVLEVMDHHFVGTSMSEIRIGGFLRDLMQGALRHRIQVPTSYTMLFKALITTEGLARMLVPEVDPVEEMMPFITRLVRARYSRDRLEQEALLYLGSFQYAARRLPIALGQVLSDYQEGRLKVPVELLPGEKAAAAAERRADRVVAAVALAGLVVAAALALPHGRPVLWGIPPFSLVLCALAALVGRSLWSGRGRHRRG
ncbi:AarF/ABC1/UbiB kinase family protein [Myxococcota bacterium]|nr:AarF/ABC1/UbiB kinase family protein [Myxococcota bacterium]